MKLGVFDSGIGGEAIAAALQEEFPHATVHTVNDTAHVPYGDRTIDEVKTLTNAAIQPLLESDCDIIIIACNTATAAAIDWLRQQYPTQLFVGIEPMIKPAVRATKTAVIAVCATPATLKSPHYKRLVQRYASDITILEPDCSNWARLIEDNEIHEANVDKTINGCIERGADVIVLGCTHYHWIKDEITKITATKALVLEPSEAIGRRVRSLLEL